MRTLLRVALLVVLAVVAFKVAGWMVGLLVGTVVLALRLAVVGALVAGAVWLYRRLARRPKRMALKGGSSSLDLDFIRGRMDKETYLHRKKLQRH